jgi:hypothetical protein
MVDFTQELSCTDGSTDASFSLSSVHPTLYKSVGPTHLNGSAPPLSQTLTTVRPPHPRPFAATPLASGDLPRVRAPPPTLHRSSCPPSAAALRLHAQSCALPPPHPS